MKTHATTHTIRDGAHRFALVLGLFVLCMGMALIVPGTAMAFDYDSWMKYLPDDMQVSQINMPGTHDSGTNYVRPTNVILHKLEPGIINNAAKCQQWTIEEQLKHGLRVLDIRLERAHEGKDWITGMSLCHGPITCFRKTTDCGDDVPLVIGTVMDWISNYLKDHPSETVVMVISEEANKDELRANQLPTFFNRFAHDGDRKNVGKYGKFFSYRPGEDVPTLGEVRGKCVMIWDGDCRPGNPFKDTFTSYEMHYKWYKPENTSPSEKAHYVTNVISEAATYKWALKYFKPSDESKVDKFNTSYYVKVVFMNPSPGMCYTAGDAVDWYLLPTA